MRFAGRTDPSVRYVVASLVAGVAFPTLPTLGILLGISLLVVGLILSVNRFTRLVMNTPAGQILGCVGIRRPMIVGFSSGNRAVRLHPRPAHRPAAHWKHYCLF